MRFKLDAPDKGQHPLEFLPREHAVKLIEQAKIDSTVKALLVALCKRMG